MPVTKQEFLYRKFVRVRERNQITLPNEILSAMNISSGDFVEVLRAADGSIQIRPTRIISSLNSPEARHQESLAEKEIQDKNFGQLTDIADVFKDAAKKRSPKPRKAAAAAAAGVSAATK